MHVVRVSLYKLALNAVYDILYGDEHMCKYNTCTRSRALVSLNDSVAK